jgi:hypothetical protein
MRTNKNGVNLDRVNPFKKERMSIDTFGSKKGSVNHQISQRKINKSD